MDLKPTGLRNISKFHIDSYNYAVEHGISAVKNNISPIFLSDSSKKIIEVQLEKASVGVQDCDREPLSFAVFPAECRIQKETYTTNLVLEFSWKKNGRKFCRTRRAFPIPLMVRSNKCVLSRRSKRPQELVKLKEDENETGGYFIVDGSEKFIRMSVVQRRNYPLAVVDAKYKDIGKDFTEYAISMRCVNSDESFKEVLLHYAKNGTAFLSFKYASYYSRILNFPLGLILRALVDETDTFICEQIMRGDENNSSLAASVKSMLRGNLSLGVHTQYEAKYYIGKAFVGLLNESVKNAVSIADKIMRECILVHLKTDVEKFTLLCYMTRKLLALVKKECPPENINNPMYHEILTSGQLYLFMLKHSIVSFMEALKRSLQRKAGNLITADVAKKCTASALSLAPDMKNMISTGNIPLKLFLKPNSGYTVVAERTNMLRFMSHFRSIMKGANIPNFLPSDIRKLRPEDWGFTCPLHTPDGELTGKKNFLAMACEIVHVQQTEKLRSILINLGMFPYYSFLPFDCTDAFPVLLDGNVVGWVHNTLAEEFAQNLKSLKSLQTEGVPQYLEVAVASSKNPEGKPVIYPGIFIFSTPGRLMRPVWNKKTKKDEYIGIFEQANQCRVALPSDIIKKKNNVTYRELRVIDSLSVLANILPFPEHNASTRSAFALHMAKQAIGVPLYSQRYRSDIKAQYLVYPQVPLVHTKYHDSFKLDDYPIGTNAVVAIMSYSGFDMEDAVIFNKASVERGFKNSHMYKTIIYELQVLCMDNDPDATYEFGRGQSDDGNYKLENFIDTDGLPYVGRKVYYQEPIFSYINTITGKTFVKHYNYKEAAYVDDVKILGNIKKNVKIWDRIAITFRSLRVPEIGDKFANWHGQKGVCSQLYKVEDMPFTSSGITPDILFNPNGLVSRMTIGMMIELMAGKVASVKCKKQVVETFGFNEDDTAIDHFCEKLESVGYSYLGTESMYSGISGKELEAHIFCGVVYYERLRHIVIDKWQVGSVAEEVDPLTQQPMKTSDDAAVRFGEMERDSLLAHGASHLLYDRFMHCSDCHSALLCTKCGELLYPVLQKASIVRPWTRRITKQNETCKLCGDTSHLEWTSVPYALIYLMSELSSLNVRMKFTPSKYVCSSKLFLKQEKP